MTEWVLVIFMFYMKTGIALDHIDGFKSYESCEIAGEAIAHNFKLLHGGYTCIQKEKK